jgi:hypothetical protein
MSVPHSWRQGREPRQDQGQRDVGSGIGIGNELRRAADEVLFTTAATERIR